MLGFQEKHLMHNVILVCVEGFLSRLQPWRCRCRDSVSCNTRS